MKIAQIIAFIGIFSVGSVWGSEAEAIAGIKKLGGTYDEASGAINLHGKKLTGSEPELALLKHLPAKSIDLGHNGKMSRFDDIWAITTLERLIIGGGGGLNAENFAGVVALKNLTFIDTHHSKLGADGYQLLAELPNLKEAFIDGWNDEEIDLMLPLLKNLEVLKVSWSKGKTSKNMTGEGIQRLAVLDGTLKNLQFVNYTVEEAKVEELKGKMPNTEVKAKYRKKK